MFHIYWCTRKSWSSSVLLYDSIIIALHHHTNNNQPYIFTSTSNLLINLNQGTSQGHFLIYYSDFTECPLYVKQIFSAGGGYSAERAPRNVVDLSKTTFIRPGKYKSEHKYKYKSKV